MLRFDLLEHEYTHLVKPFSFLQFSDDIDTEHAGFIEHKGLHGNIIIFNVHITHFEEVLPKDENRKFSEKKTNNFDKMLA